MADPVEAVTPLDPTATTTTHVCQGVFSGLVDVVSKGLHNIQDGAEYVEHQVVDFFHTVPGQAAIASLETAVLTGLSSFLPAKLAQGEAAVIATISDAEVQKFIQGVLVGVTGIVGTMITEFLSRVPSVPVAPVAPPSTPPTT